MTIADNDARITNKNKTIIRGGHLLVNRGPPPPGIAACSMITLSIRDTDAARACVAPGFRACGSARVSRFIARALAGTSASSTGGRW